MSAHASPTPRSLTLEEARERAAVLSAVSYDLELDLTAPEQGTFGCRTTVRFAATTPQTFLELTAATDLEVVLNGVRVDPAYDGRRIALAGLAGANEVLVSARLPYVSDGDGMHLVVDPADGEVYVSAYLGMDVSQRVFPCFDQVDLKAPLTLAVRADPAWTILANGRPTDRSGGEWRFAPTPPIPPDLFVVCAGPWHSVTWEHAGLPFGWHARRSLAAELERDAAELRATTEACFDHYTGLFEEPYPFDSYDQAFVPGQNWGAQEMPGCVLYRDELLPPGRITEQRRSLRATIIAHEMAHMWFGNLVTMRWWEDTWLNESFADYLGYRVAEDAAGFPGTLVTHEAQRKPGAYDADLRRSTHPVAPRAEEVPDVDAAFSNFDAISYAKGNSVLRQLVTWLGDEAFLAGVNDHLTRHRFGNATLDDLVDALDAVSERDVHGWAQVWLRRSGHDTLRVVRDGDMPVLVRDGVRPHRLRVTAYDAGLSEVGSTLVDLDDEPVRLEDWAGLVVVPNSHGETFARLELDERSWRAVQAGLSGIRDDLARTVLWQTVFARVQARTLAPADHLRLVADHLPHETHPALVTAVLERTTGAVLGRRVPPAEVAGARDVLAAACAAGLAGLGAQADADLAHEFAAGLLAHSRDRDLLGGALAEGGVTAGAAGRGVAGVELDQGLRWAVLRRLAEVGAAVEGPVAAELARDPSVAGELGAAAALAARPTASAKAQAWAAMGEEQVSNRRFAALAGGLWSGEQAELLAPYVERYLADGPRLAARRGQAFSQVVGRAFPSFTLDRAQRARLEEALAGDVPAVLRRSWEDRLDDLDH